MEKSEESEVKKGPWTPEEDEKLVDCIQKHGHRNWKELANLAGLNRCGKSCRLRWNNYLRPDIKRGSFSDQEQSLIIDLHSKLGNKWSVIASYMPGRTDNEIKNFWNTHLKKRLLLNGIDPVTHMPTTTTDHLNSFLPLILLGRANSTTSSGNLWENALRLQTEAAQAAKILLIGNIMQLLNSSTNPSRPLPMEAFNPNSQSANNNIPLQLEGLFNNPQPCLNNIVPHQPIFHGDYNYNDEIRNNVLTGNIEGNNSEFIKASSSSSSFIYPDYRMPDLVSASPERLSRDNQTHYGTYPTDFSNPSSTSTTFEALGDLMDDEATNYYWKQILDRATLSP